MLTQPNESVRTAKPYQIQLMIQVIEVRYFLEVATDEYDEWIISPPAYSLGQKVWIIAPDVPPSDWEEKRVFGIELYAPRWQHGSLMCEPVWYYGVKGITGQGETKWLTQEQITYNRQACDLDSDHF
jgi:hypothetical protein